MNEKPPIREQCRWLRVNAGLSQAELAKEAYLSTPCVAQLETGRRNPTLSTLEAYLKPLGFEIAIKRKAMKPISKPDYGVRYTDVYLCPACGKPFSGTGVCNYCYRCGQEIDWSKDDQIRENYMYEEDE